MKLGLRLRSPVSLSGVSSLLLALHQSPLSLNEKLRERGFRLGAWCETETSDIYEDTIERLSQGGPARRKNVDPRWFRMKKESFQLSECIVS